MATLIRRFSFPLTIALVICSLAFNLLQYHNSRVIRYQVVTDGLGLSFTYLEQTSSLLTENKTQQADSSLGLAIGGILAVRLPLVRYGVTRLTGIVLELQTAQSELNNPQKYTENEIHTMRSFIQLTAGDFSKSFVNEQVVLSNVNTAIAKIYASMPSKDRKKFEGIGP